jgi:hypothetical protein
VSATVRQGYPKATGRTGTQELASDEMPRDGRGHDLYTVRGSISQVGPQASVLLG